MALDPGIALDYFVAGSLWAVASALLFSARRRRETVLVALFLGVVGGNFLGIGLSHATGQSGWATAAYVLLALDPFLLLGFAVSYPYPRYTPTVRVLMGGFAIVAATGAAVALLRPAEVADATRWEHAFLIGALVIQYAAAFLVSVRATLEAPTPRLAERSAWTVRAIGVAVVPRLALVGDDFHLGTSPLFEGLVGASGLLAETVRPYFRLVLVLTFSAAALAAAWAAARWGRRSAPSELRSAFRFVANVVVALILAAFLLDAFGWEYFRGGLLYGLRWILFAALLLHGILAFQVVELRATMDRVATLLGGLLGALALALATAVYLETQNVGPPIQGTLLLAVGLAAAVPAAVGARAVVRTLERRAGTRAPADRRLELYRAALEGAWARGSPPPSLQRQLERDRRAFGLTPEEARTLEYVVATATAPAPAPLVPGQEALPGLVVERLLGEGGHGRVYRAVRRPQGRRIVVKELRQDRSGAKDARQHLLREARALQGLRHPRIVPFLDLHIDEGRYLLLFDYVEAAPLSTRLRAGPLPGAHVQRLLDQALEGLVAAHARGIVHRDLKPSNLLVNERGELWITDFGLAVTPTTPEALGATISGLDAVGAFAGTLAYMAPEQVRGRPADASTDLYALGLVTYELITGRRATDLQGFDVLSALGRVAHPRVDWTPVPRAWRGFLNRALEADPRRRFRSAAEMRTALAGIRIAGPAGRRRVRPE